MSMLFPPWVFPHPFLQIPIASLISGVSSRASRNDCHEEGAIDLSKKSSSSFPKDDDSSSGPVSPGSGSAHTSDDDALSSSGQFSLLFHFFFCEAPFDCDFSQILGSRGYSKEESQACRDEKKALQLKIPISMEDIVNLPMDEFNERLSRHELNEVQLSLIRDIRRRGKNKVRFPFLWNFKFFSA